jgi:hypothetical protein
MGLLLLTDAPMHNLPSVLQPVAPHSREIIACAGAKSQVGRQQFRDLTGRGTRCGASAPHLSRITQELIFSLRFVSEGYPG